MKIEITVEYLQGSTSPQIILAASSNNDPIAKAIASQLIDINVISQLIKTNRIVANQNSTAKKKIYDYNFD
jgi:hypothetical protein